MENNIIVGSVPWPIACLTALWFGIMAYKARKNAVLWSIGGGVLGLVSTTIVLGLAQSVFIPMAGDEISSYRVKAAAVAIVVVVFLGWLFAGSLHPHIFAPWKRAPEPVKEPVVEQTPKPSAEQRKT